MFLFKPVIFRFQLLIFQGVGEGIPKRSKKAIEIVITNNLLYLKWR